MRIMNKCLKEPVEQGAIVFEDGKPKVYKKRFHILCMYCLGYLIWNWHTSRQIILATEFAEYFDTTNSFNPPDELGIDFFFISDNIALICFYPLAGYLVDNYGIRVMIVASMLQSASAWWWYLSFTNYYSVLASRILAAIGGTTNAAALLKICNSWFPANERPIAVGVAVLVANLGSGLALLVGPMFSTGDRKINVNLKSCLDSFREDFNTSGSLECTDEAQDAFCCVSPTEIELYNLILALITSAIMLYTIAAFQDKPLTPPGLAGLEKKAPGFLQALKLMFSKRNYSQICLADFVASGPPLVLFATIDRIIPASVAEYDFFVAAGGIVIAIPVAAYVTYILGKNRSYFSVTFMSYTGGFSLWAAATICYAVGTYAADIAILFLAGGSLVMLVVWTISVYELKMEYTYSSEYNVSGFVVAIDRTIINLSSLIYVSSIPPERFGEDGRVTTMYIGAAALFIAVALVWTIPQKYKYLRKEHEDELSKDGPISFENL